MAKNHEVEKTTIGPDAEGRYYYKAKNGNGLLNFKHALTKLEHADDYVEITKEEFESLQPKPYEPTAEEIAKNEKKSRIAYLKGELSKTDYCVIKIAEGVATAEEYADVLTQRQAWRTEINALEEEVK